MKLPFLFSSTGSLAITKESEHLFGLYAGERSIESITHNLSSIKVQNINHDTENVDVQLTPGGLKLHFVRKEGQALMFYGNRIIITYVVDNGKILIILYRHGTNEWHCGGHCNSVLKAHLLICMKASYIKTTLNINRRQAVREYERMKRRAEDARRHGFDFPRRLITPAVLDFLPANECPGALEVVAEGNEETGDG